MGDKLDSDFFFLEKNMKNMLFFFREKLVKNHTYVKKERGVKPSTERLSTEPVVFTASNSYIQQNRYLKLPQNTLRRGYIR